jgi:hypothetical protein
MSALNVLSLHEFALVALTPKGKKILKQESDEAMTYFSNFKMKKFKILPFWSPVLPQDSLGGVGGKCELGGGGGEGTGLTCLVPNFAIGPLGGVGGHCQLGGGEGCGPKPDSCLVSERLSIRWVRFQIGSESDGFGFR